MDLQEVLLACQNPNTVHEAEEHLAKLAREDLGQLLLQLVAILATDGKAEPARQLAGLYVKNALSANNPALLQQKLHAWAEIPVDVREHIKIGALSSLSSNSDLARRAGAQVTAKIGSIEVPNNKWGNLIRQLHERVQAPQEPVSVKVAALETLGFMSEELALNECMLPEATTNEMLTVIIHSMLQEHPEEMRLAATTALRNSVEFASANFAKEVERNVIMQVVCEATQCKDEKVRVVAFECIAQIAKCYYQYLQPYVDVLADLTMGSVQGQPEQVAQQAIEFWSTICEEESLILMNIREATEYGEPLENLRQCMNYAKQALNRLVPLLTYCLLQQDEDPDEDEWNLSMSGAACLRLLATTVMDDIMSFIMPFITTSIQSHDWRQREAAVIAFGSIMEGVSPPGLQQYITGATPLLIQQLKNPNEHPLVKDSTAWTVGEMCSFHPTAISQEQLPELIESLMLLLGGPSGRVAERSCSAIHNLAAAFESASGTGETNALSPHFEALAKALIDAADRPDAVEYNIRVNAYEALNRLVQNAASDVTPVIGAMVPHIVEKLKGTFSMEVLSRDDREHQQGLQGLLCGVLQCCSLKLGNDIAGFADSMMECYLNVLSVKNAIAQEDAYLAVGALADALEENFLKYYASFYPFIIRGLQQIEEWQVCKTTVNVLGDVCRALGRQILGQCNEIVENLLGALGNANLHQDVKPHLLSVFSDLAIAIGGNFEQYVPKVMHTLSSAAAITVENEQDEDAKEFLQELRVSVLEAFTGILQGLIEDRKQQLLVNYLPNILVLLQRIQQDPLRTDDLIKQACDVIGDVAWSLGPHFRKYAGSDIIRRFIDEGLHGPPASAKSAQWAQEKVHTLLSAGM